MPVKKCQFCNYVIVDPSIPCSSCGSVYVEPPAHTSARQPENPPASNGKKHWVLAALALLALMGLVYGVMRVPATTVAGPVIECTENRGVTGTGIAAGGGSSFAIKYDGSLWTWGAFLSQEDRLEPIWVMNDVVSVSAGSHIAAIRTDSSLWVWGGNYAGQIGQSDMTAVFGLRGIINRGSLVHLMFDGERSNSQE